MFKDQSNAFFDYNGIEIRFQCNQFNGEGFVQNHEVAFLLELDHEVLTLSIANAHKLKDYLIEMLQYHADHQPKTTSED